MNATAMAHDPAVPYRDAMLDGEAMAARLARTMGRDGPLAIESCEPLRAKYQVGRSLRVLYAVSAAGARHLVSARTFRHGRAAEVHRSTAGAAQPSGPVRGVAHDGELGAVFFAFPNDRKLGGTGRRDQSYLMSSRLPHFVQATFVSSTP